MKKTLYNDFDPTIKTTAYYLFNIESAIIEKVVNHAKSNNILTFSYDFALLNNGVLFSLYTGSKIRPYLNVKQMQNQNLTFKKGFLQIVKPFRSNK